MADIVTDKRITQSEVDKVSSSFVLDLTAFYKVLLEDILEIIGRAGKEAWTEEQIIEEVNKLLE